MMLAAMAKYQDGKMVPEGVRDAMLEEIRKHLAAYGFTDVQVYYVDQEANRGNI